MIDLKNISFSQSRMKLTVSTDIIVFSSTLRIKTF